MKTYTSILVFLFTYSIAAKALYSQKLLDIEAKKKTGYQLKSLSIFCRNIETKKDTYFVKKNSHY